MENNRLISMVDFVIKEEDYISQFHTRDARTFEPYNRIVRYANFLKQPLTLGMFVPVDESGNVLIEPYNDGMNDQYYGSAIDAYNKAK